MPSQIADHKAEALGRQVLSTVLSLFQEGLETENRSMLKAAYAPINWEEHPNKMFRALLLKHLNIRLFTMTSPDPIMNQRLVPGQWVEIDPQDVQYIVRKVVDMRKDATKQLNELLRAESTPERPE